MKQIRRSFSWVRGQNDNPRQDPSSNGATRLRGRGSSKESIPGRRVIKGKMGAWRGWIWGRGRGGGLAVRWSALRTRPPRNGGDEEEDEDEDEKGVEEGGRVACGCRRHGRHGGKGLSTIRAACPVAAPCACWCQRELMMYIESATPNHQARERQTQAGLLFITGALASGWTEAQTLRATQAPRFRDCC